MSDPTVSDRLMRSLRALIRAQFPNLRYAGFFDYAIDAVSGEPPNVLIDATPRDQSLGLPSVVQVPCQPSVGGETGIPSKGMGCVVIFLDSNPTKPRIIGFDSLGTNPVARVGDQIQAFLPPVLPIQGTVGGSPFTGFATIANPITGVISQGSGKVFSG